MPESQPPLFVCHLTHLTHLAKPNLITQIMLSPFQVWLRSSELMFVDILCVRCRLALPSAATSSACRYATTPFSNGRDFEPQNLHKDANSNLKIL